MILMQEKLVGGNYYLNKSAKDAYRSYLLAYNSHSMKEIFNVHRLDMQVPIAYLYINVLCMYESICVCKWSKNCYGDW